MGYLKSAGTTFIYVSFFLAVLTFIPGCPPDVKLSEYSVEPTIELEGNLATNDRLNDPEILHYDSLMAPESFESYNGELYTSTYGGYVMKVDEDKIVPFVKFGKKCDYIWQEEICGRPLGLRADRKGFLYVVDTYYGLYKVDATGKYDLIINTSKPIDNLVPRCPNSIDIAKNGDIYWTDSSTDFFIKDGLFSTLANPSGRLIRYNPATKKNTVLVKNLAFANGLLLSDDESFVIVAETFTSRIVKYHLKGPKAGTKEIFVDRLPGFPDNVHSDGQGGFLVTTVSYIDLENPSLVHVLMPHPYIRKMLIRSLWLIQTLFRSINNIYPNYYAEKAVHIAGSFHTTMSSILSKMVVLRIDRTGKIIDVAYSTDGKLSGSTSAFIHDDYLWLGSFSAKHISRVPLKKAFPDLVLSKKNAKDSRSNVPKSQNVKELPKTSTARTTEKSTTKAPVPSKKPDAPTNAPKSTTTTTTSTTTTTKPTTTERTTTTAKTTTTTSTTTPKPSNIPKSSSASKSNDDSAKPATAKLNSATVPKTTVKEIKTNIEKESTKSEKPVKHSSETKESKESKEKLKLQHSNSVKKDTKPDVPKSSENQYHSKDDL